MGILQAHPDGMRTADLAERVGMSVRTVYRDLKAIDEEIVPVWADGGRWGIDQEKAFLPPLKLTQAEAMAVVLSARLMVRYADKYDPDLAAAFEKLAVGLAAGARGVRRADPRHHVDGAAGRGVLEPTSGC